MSYVASQATSSSTSTPSGNNGQRRKGLPVNLSLLENVLLPQVHKPGRYLGLEQGAYKKPFHTAKATLAFAFPDLYEIGLSNYGIKLLYSIVNQHPHYLCDRVYAFAGDLRALAAEHNLPLFGVESKVPVKDFDLLAFSLQYELNTTTLLGMLESAQLPLRAKDRPTLDYPIVIGGGPGSGNPMPLIPFFDAIILGDGEEILIELLDTITEGKTKGWEKPAMMAALGAIDGVYIPGQSERAYKRIVDIAEKHIDIAPLIPAVAAVHDRVVVEARRGCDRMCRFCQPSFMNLPTREQSVENIKKSALAELEKTGYEECSLLSLSIADYSHFKPLVMEVTDALKDYGASLSLSSQRADRFSVEVAEAVSSVKKSTLTFAPEAGTNRMRNVINKNLSDAEILNAVTSAYKAGWNKVKLYFMIGLPTETQEDLDGIVVTVKRLQQACKAISREKALSNKKHLEVNVTISNFVPKPHTPFQWFAQDSMPMLRDKIAYLRGEFRGVPGTKVNFTDPEISKLEAVISKAGPELADVIELAYRKGAYLDAWEDMSSFDKWFEALHELGLDEETYTRDRLVSLDDELPWDPIDMGLDKEWLKEEYRKATEAASTTPCFETCSTCGVCATYSTWPKFIDPPKEGFSTGILKITKVHKREVLPPVERVVLKLEKRGRLRFISHLDWLRLVMRAMKRAKLPMAYSQGYHPKPKVTFSPALPLMMESMGEWIELELTTLTPNVAKRLNAYLPEGGQAVEEEHVAVTQPKLTKRMMGVSYEAAPNWPEDLGCGGDGQTPPNARTMQPSLLTCVETFLAQDAWLVTTSEDDMPPTVLDCRPYLSQLSADSHHTVTLTFQQVTALPTEAASIEPAEGMPHATADAAQASLQAPIQLFSLRPRWILSQLVSSLPVLPASWTIRRQAIHLAPLDSSAITLSSPSLAAAGV